MTPGVRAWFALVALSAASALLAADQGAWLVHHEAARKAIEAKNFDLAKKEAQAGFDVVVRLGPSDPRYIRAMMDQAEAEPQTNDAASEARLLKALELGEQNGTFKNKAELENQIRHALLTRISRIATRFNTSSRYAEALAEERRGLVQLARMKPVEPRLAVPLLNRVGVVLKGDGYFKLAETVFNRALAVKEDPLLLSNLADLYIRLGRYAEAEKTLERAITVEASSQAQAGAETSVGFQRSLRLAILNNELGHFDVADSIVTEATQSAKGASVDVGVNQVLGNADCGRGRFESAFGHYQKAFEASLPSSLGRAEILVDRGRCAARNHDLTRAAQDMEDARTLLQKHARPAHPEFAIVRWRQAAVLETQKKLTEADGALNDALSRFEAAADPNVPLLAAMLDDLARVQKSLGHLGAAQLSINRARAIRAKWLKPHPIDSTPLAPIEAAELIYWDTIQAQPDPAQYRAYLTDFPNGKFTAEARAHSGH
jgi:tetratricopeptide (TPR) repeat protein